MNALTLGAIAAAIGMPAGLKFLHWLFPVKAVMPAESSFAELKSQYQKWTSGLAVLMLLVAVPLSLVFWFLLKSLATWHAMWLPPADMTFAPVIEAYWLLPAFLLGLVGGGVAALWIARRLLGKRYGEFLAYWSLSSGVNPVKANVSVFQVCTIICAGLIFIGLRAYVQLTDDTLVVNGFISREVRYPLADIQNIRTSPRFTAPNGDLVSRREYVVTFTDGRNWTTSFLPSDPDQEAKSKLVATLSARSGKPIEEVEIFAKGEL